MDVSFGSSDSGRDRSPVLYLTEELLRRYSEPASAKDMTCLRIDGGTRSDRIRYPLPRAVPPYAPSRAPSGPSGPAVSTM